MSYNTQYDPLVSLQNKIKSNISVIRIGSIDDGGYDIPDSIFKDVKIFISGGLSSNVEFEYDIFRFCNCKKLILIDPTVSINRLIIKGFVRLFFPNIKDKFRYLSNAFIFAHLCSNKNVIFLKKWIDKDFDFNLSIYSESTVLVKLDIECGEYFVLNQLITFKNKLKCMIIEFHDFNIKYEDVINFTSQIADSHDMYFLNVNPSGGFDITGIPKVLEIGFLAR